MTIPHPALADFLDARREAITSEWISRVRRDREIPSADDLPREELLDHMPFLLSSLIERLRGTPHAGSETTRQSQVHGETRANQNYRLQELLTEVSILRNVLIEVWMEFDSANSPDRRVQLESAGILHEILDDVIAESTAGFVTRQQEELLAVNRALEEANFQTEALNVQLAERDDRRLRTLRTISHEIANHLNAAGLMVTMIQRTASVDPAAGSSLAAIARSVAAMTSLMRQLLEFSTLTAAEEKFAPVIFDPMLLCEELAAVAGPLATERGLAFSTEFDPALGSIIADPEILRRIGLNLLTNAIKYTPAGSVVLAFRSVDEATWCVQVTDTGHGIHPDEQTRIYDEFYRAQSAGKSAGVGLGLAITRQLVALSAGRIELESKPDAGSTFRVFLPKS